MEIGKQFYQSMKPKRKNVVIIGESEPLIPQEPSWLVREHVGTKTPMPGGVYRCLVHWELVWGTMEKDKNQITRVSGRVVHALSGPTAESSIRAVAAKLNAEKALPPEPKPKTRADGYSPKGGGPMHEYNEWHFA